MRAGSSAMIARRSASLIAPQPAISASVRPQPMQSPVMPLTAQVLMHGLETEAGASSGTQCRARPPVSSAQIAAVVVYIELR